MSTNGLFMYLRLLRWRQLITHLDGFITRKMEDTDGSLLKAHLDI